jgi:predicted Zn-ribbon and HTH transcriptional regulator
MVFVKRCRCGYRLTVDAGTIEVKCPKCKRRFIVEVKAVLKELK